MKQKIKSMAETETHKSPKKKVKNKLKTEMHQTSWPVTSRPGTEFFFPDDSFIVFDF